MIFWLLLLFLFVCLLYFNYFFLGGGGVFVYFGTQIQECRPSVRGPTRGSDWGKPGESHSWFQEARYRSVGPISEVQHGEKPGESHSWFWEAACCSSTSQLTVLCTAVNIYSWLKSILATKEMREFEAVSKQGFCRVQEAEISSLRPPVWSLRPRVWV